MASPSPEIDIDLWPRSSWEDRDLYDLSSLLGDFGGTAGRRAGGLSGLGLHLTITFVAGAVASGFFKALGQELYARLRTKLTEIANRPAQRHPERLPGGRGDLLAFIIEDSASGLEMHIYGWHRNSTELDEFLQAVGPAFDALSLAIAEGRHPCIREKRHSIRAEWKAVPDVAWEVSVHVSERLRNTDRDVSLVSMCAFAESRALNRSSWAQLRWLDPESASHVRAKRDAHR
jgi:hypothetical protein